MANLFSIPIIIFIVLDLARPSIQAHLKLSLNTNSNDQTITCNCTVTTIEGNQEIKCGQSWGIVNSPSCSHTSQSIVGGTKSSPQAWPWQVLTLSDVICGGTLIHPKYVLTAAHCTDGRNAESIKSYAGFVKMDDIFKGHVWSSGVKKIIQHPDFNAETLENDISILELNQSAEISHSINTACLPNSTEDITDTDDCFTTGWGVTQDEEDRQKVLQEVCLPYIPSQTCENEFYNNYPIHITKGMFCAGYAKGGKDSCQGDSGGPYVCHKENGWTLFGVVSWGQGCAEKGYPGVYTDVRKYIPFIVSSMKNN